ncbi:MAG: TonB-dependent receptor [Cyclobacteriaceae bacterium]|nr:TonB-dependent receptor [Cyclobacteriaceae bacterium]
MLTLLHWYTPLIRFYTLIGLLLITSTYGKAQNEIPSIHINVINSPLIEVLNEIATQGDLHFSYNPKKIRLDQKITYSANKPVKDILEDLMKIASLQYTYLEKQIILKPLKTRGKNTNKNTIIHGYIKDNNNGEALIGATIYVSELNTGTMTNAFGFYSIALPKGEYNLSYSFIGFEENHQIISLTNATNIDVELVEKPPILEEVVVVASAPQLVEEIQMSKSELQPKTVSEMPALFGEMDVIKSLEFVPGVKSHSDGSTFNYIRGGNRDQNMIMIDDAPIYNPSHMLGVFSTIIPDAINHIHLYKGDMPASMGGRLSSVIDIRTKNGNNKKLQAWGNTGLISSKLGLEGPIAKDKSSFLMSGRISHAKWLYQQKNENIQQFYFYDLTGKLNFNISPKDKLFISSYSGSDNYFENNSGVNWANTTGSIKWTHLFNNRIFLNTTIAGSSYQYFLHADIENNTKWKSRIANLNFKGDFTYFIRPQSVLTFGIAANGHNLNPGNLTSNDTKIQPPLVSIKNVVEGIAYINHEARVNDQWGVKYGLRFSSWNNQGASFEFEFDENHHVIDTLFFDLGENYNQYNNIEPRLGLSYFFNKNSALKFSYSRNVQNLHLITNSISPFTSLEVWLPSSINIKPQIANQVAIGYLKFYPNIGVSLTIEGYYKIMKNQIDYKTHAETLLNSIFEGELRFGTSNSYGAEFLLKKKEGRLRGWLGYTYARVKNTFPELNNGQPFNAFYDRPHEVNLILGYDITKRIHVGTNWTYYTGSPYSSPISFFNFNGLETPIYGQRNNSRLPDYHRMDISATLNLNRDLSKKFTHDLTLSFYNVYGRKNTLFINYNKTETENGDFRIPSNLLENSRTSSQFYLFRFTPSLTYNFRFL